MDNYTKYHKNSTTTHIDFDFMLFSYQTVGYKKSVASHLNAIPNQVFIVLIMQKQILLISILLLSVLGQAQVIAYSSEGSPSVTIEDDNRTIKDPPTAKSVLQSPRGIVSLKVQQVQTAPPNFNFLDENSLNNDAKWVSANSRAVLGMNSLTTFTINYTTFCNSPVSLSISASNIFRVLHNGNTVQGWSCPWPSIFTINLTPSCQCNTITVQVFNCFYPSPASIIYSLSQNTGTCFNCGRQNLFWNYRTCNCECKRNCCPKGQILTKQSCQCMKIISGYGSLNIDAGNLGPN